MPVNFLCWHGTILRVDNATGAWFHALVWPDDDSGSDLALELPGSGVDHPVMLDGFVAEPGREAGQVFLRRDAQYLCADPARPFVHFERPLAGPLECFQLAPPAIIQRLRAVLAGPARIEETGTRVRAELTDGLMLRIDQRDFPLGKALPGPGGGLIMRLGGLRRTLIPLGGHETRLRTEIPLQPAEPRQTHDAADFRSGDSAVLQVAAGIDHALPPTTLSDADQIWMQQRPWFPERQFWGAMESTCEIGRARNVTVLLSRGQEGGIFNADGFLTDPVYLQTMIVMDNGCLSRHGRRVFIDNPALDDAPLLRGPHVVFYGGVVVNYFHWLIEALVPLSILAPHVPPDATLLLPPSLAATGRAERGGQVPPYLAMLDHWGFTEMKRHVAQSPVCRVEEVYWLRNLNLDSIPGECFRAARDRALAALPGPARERRRIYIQRPGIRRVSNAVETETCLAGLGFSVHQLSGMHPVDQMALFRDADFVVAPHGADLANLLFCAPGTKVIELSPDLQFRGFYGHISDKLGLSHAVLPCATQQSSFDADFPVDPARLAALFHLMQARS